MTTRAMAAKYLEMSKPPGPPAFWFGLGAAIRSVGKAVDEAGRLMQMETGHDEKRAARPQPRACERERAPLPVGRARAER